jgi:tRNA modification GTPase
LRRLAVSSVTYADDGDARPLSRPPSAGDTVYALSTGASGAAGVAVVRISGPHATLAAAALIGNSTAHRGAIVHAQPLPKPRRAALRKLYAPRTGELLDEAIVLIFPGPNSFTGEDVVELQTHGSRAVVAGVLGALADLGDQSQGLALRPADRGEFTQRAFENGRLGLTEVEGLADLLAADTAAQRQQALAQMGGATERLFARWRAVLATCLAHAEAVIDFGDDEDDVDADRVFQGLLPQARARFGTPTERALGQEGGRGGGGVAVAC